MKMIKKLVIGAVCCGIFNIAEAKDEWFAQDKAKHFSISVGMGAIATSLMPKDFTDEEKIVGGTLAGFLVGFSKELYDKSTPGRVYSYKDMTWDFAGSLLGSYLFNSAVKIYYQPKTATGNETVMLTYEGKF